MDKLTMAHDWAMRCNRTDLTMRGFVDLAWSYADAMQAEADKRNYSEKQDSSEWQPDFVPTEILAHDAWRKSWQRENIKPSLEWQPDWSQAPDNCHFFCVASNDGYGFFNNIKPKLMGDYFYVGCGGLMIEDHGYQGNWQDSLRKRPQ